MAIEKKFNTEAVNDYPPIRFEIRFERKFPTVGLYFMTLPVETLRNLCPVEKLFGMQMAGFTDALVLFFFFSYACHEQQLVSHETATSSADCSQNKPPFSFVGAGFDNVVNRLGLATRT